jgi:Leucine Rich Repeat (LRR) protein
MEILEILEILEIKCNHNAALRVNMTLTKLSLHNNKIGDAGAAALAEGG